MSVRLSPTGHPLASHMVGAVFLVLVLVVVVAIFQTGRVREWISPGQEIRVVLPQEGLFGLSEGAAVEILGTRAGSVERIVIEPDQQIHAEIRIRTDMKPFVRQDSNAFIRKRFGVAGESFIEITRGFGEPLDWDFAVVEAKVDRAPTDTLQSILEELREKAVPMLEQTNRALIAWTEVGERLADPEGDVSQFLANLNTVSGRIERGEGVIGQLISNEQLVDDLRGSLASVRASLARLEPVIEDLQAVTADAASLTGALAERKQQVPELLDRVTATVASVQAVLDDLKQTTPKLPQIVDDIGRTTEQFPALILQLQQTLRELEQLTKQVQRNWLLGGSGATPREGPPRIRPGEAAP